jgi:hypothetical protein
VINTDSSRPPAIPGPGTLTQQTLQHLDLALAADLLVNTGMVLPSFCPIGAAHYLAVLLRRHPSGTLRDFHCVRLDRNGHWSHKDGAGTIRKRDDAGRATCGLRNDPGPDGPSIAWSSPGLAVCIPRLK